MSWSQSTKAKKEEIEAAIDAVTIPETQPDGARKQLVTAKAAAKLLVAELKGPEIAVTMNGHFDESGNPGAYNSIGIQTAQHPAE
jgi:hypothetical protein